jgi:hypothetical protein
MRRCNLVFCAMISLSAPSLAWGDADSVAAINAIGLKRPDGAVLSGAGVNIGQVEPLRAAVHGFDTAPNTNQYIIPIESRNVMGQNPSGPDDGAVVALPDPELEGHALRVAGIMIGSAGAPTSVSPGASLYSAGYAYPFVLDDEQLLTTQYIAKRYAFTDSRHIRVINHSWGDVSGGPYDGNSPLTLGMDWMASRFDVLNVNAGPYSDKVDIPTDNYNGITVAFTAKSRWISASRCAE